MSVISAGIIFCLCGFMRTVPKGVTVNGSAVGGMTLQGAVDALRKKTEEDLKGKQLKIIGEKSQYVFTFPEITYRDDYLNVLYAAKRGGAYSANVKYMLCGMDEIINSIAAEERVERVEPHALFNASGEPFTYFEGNDGRQVDFSRLKADILTSLKGGFEPVKIKYLTAFRRTTLASVRQNTVLLGKFTTSFNGSNVNRASNIRLAAALINGMELHGGKIFSFNAAVGERLPERGFRSAKIIKNGEYVEGVGGGVCQVSTTLYNAALLSGLTVTEYHPHSLAVGYVGPSRDAMVSGSACDLKFKNPSASPVYIRAHTKSDSVTVEIYGKSDGAQYSLESVVTGEIPAKEEFCTDPAQVKEGKNGVTSEGWLVVARGGFVKKIKIRTDRYAPQTRVKLSAAEENGQNGQTAGQTGPGGQTEQPEKTVQNAG